MSQNDEAISDAQKAIGVRIRDRRKQLALSMGDLTQLSGVDIGTISRAEAGSSQITVDTAIQLSRALQIPLTDLVEAIRFGAQKVANTVVTTSALHITDQDVLEFVQLYRARREHAEGMIIGWLNTLAEQMHDNDGEHIVKILQDTNVQLLLLRPSLFQFRINLPENSAFVAVGAMYQHGGDIGQGDIQLLLAAISDNNNLFQKLDRQSKDILRRLQSRTPDRIKVSDLAKLESDLNIDLFGMLATAERITSSDFESSDEEQKIRTNEARLISLFITIMCWFSVLQPNSSEWMPIIRSEIRHALQQAQSTDSGAADQQN